MNLLLDLLAIAFALFVLSSAFGIVLTVLFGVFQFVKYLIPRR